MKRVLTLACAVLALVTLAAADIADARRLGGGKSLGAQRQAVPQSPAPAPSAPAASTPSGAASQPVMPASPGAASAAKPAGAAAAPAASGASRWLGPIAGLAAGLGLAALLSHFGLSEGFASLLLMALLIGGAVLLVRMLMARRAAAPSALRYAAASGAPQSLNVPPSGGGPRVEPVLAPNAPEPVSTTHASSKGGFPPGFDAEAFAVNAKLQFIALQAAHDAADRKALSNVMTPAMYAQIVADLGNRGAQPPTEIVSLDAQVLEAGTEGREHWASVRYSGTLREDGAATPTAFDEVWNLTKPVDGSSGWVLAGIQQRS
jgi:predicted lipid-binding transport protein (Tim44 family)